MPSLELAIQAQQMRSGGAEARAELDQIIQKGKETERAMGVVSSTSTTTGASMREAFGAGRGALNLSRGLQGITDSLGGVVAGTKDLSQVGLVTAGVMMQIGRTADDWRQLSTAVTTTQRVVREATRDVFGIQTGFRDVVQTQRQVTTGWSALATVMRANPVMTIAGVLTAAAGAMSLFSAATSSAADSWKVLAGEISKVRVGGDIADLFGDKSLSAGASKREYQLLYEKAIEAHLRGNVDQPSIYGFSRGLGIDPTATLRSLAGMELPEYMRGDNAYQRLLDKQYSDPASFRQGIEAHSLNRDQQLELLRRRAEQVRAQLQTPADRGWDVRSPADPWKSNISYPDLGNYFEEEERMAKADGYQMKFWQKEDPKQELQEMSQLGRELHATFADAGAVLLMNLGQSRAILKDMLNTMTQTLLRTGIASVTEGLFGAGFGRTSKQLTPGVDYT